MLLAQSNFDPTATALFYLFALVAGGSAVCVVVSRNIVRMAVALLFTLAGVAGLYFLLNAEFLAAVQLVVYAGGTLILIIFGVMLTTKSPFSRFEPKLGEIVVALTMAVVLLTAMVMAVPLAETAERVGPNRIAPALVSLPPPLKDKVRYDGERLWYHGQVSPAERQDLLAAVDAEYQDRAHAIDADVAEADKQMAAASDPGDKRQWQEKKDRLAADRQAVTADYGSFRAAVESVAGRSQRFFLADRSLPTGQAYPVAFLGQKLLGDYLLPFEIASVLLLVVMIGAAYLAKGRRREAAAPAERTPAEGELSRQARQWT